jgi:hypothetical protein
MAFKSDPATTGSCGCHPIIRWLSVFVAIDAVIFAFCVAFAKFVMASCSHVSICQPVMLQSIYYLYLPVSVVSFGCSTWTVLSFFTNKKFHKKQHLRFVVMMSLCDSLFSFKFLVTSSASLFWHDFRFTTTGTWQCSLMGFFGKSFGTAVIAWNFVIMCDLFLLLRYPFRYHRIANGRLFLGANVFVWIVSLGQGIAVLVMNGYSQADDGTCYLQGAFFVDAFFVLIGVAFVWGIFVISYSLIVARRRSPQLQTVIVDAVCFILAMFCSWSFNGVLFFTPNVNAQNMATNAASAYFVYSNSIAVGLQGFFNFLVWGVRITKSASGCCSDVGFNRFSQHPTSSSSARSARLALV